MSSKPNIFQKTLSTLSEGLARWAYTFNQHEVNLRSSIEEHLANLKWQNDLMKDNYPAYLALQVIAIDYVMSSVFTELREGDMQKIKQLRADNLAKLEKTYEFKKMDESEASVELRLKILEEMYSFSHNILVSVFLNNFNDSLFIVQVAELYLQFKSASGPTEA